MPELVYVVEGRRYPVVAMDELSLWDQMDLTKETGITPERLEVLLKDVVSVGDEGAKFATPDDVYASREHLMAMAIHMWMARRAAGEKQLTVREAASVPLKSWSMLVEGEDLPDPTEPPQEPAPDPDE